MKKRRRKRRPELVITDRCPITNLGFPEDERPTRDSPILARAIVAAEPAVQKCTQSYLWRSRNSGVRQMNAAFPVLMPAEHICVAAQQKFFRSQHVISRTRGEAGA
jgi:hypothetical protein